MASQIGASGSTSAGANWPPNHVNSGGYSRNHGSRSATVAMRSEKRSLEGIHLLARDQADAALGHERLWYGRGPVAGPYDAYVDGHFVT